MTKLASLFLILIAATAAVAEDEGGQLKKAEAAVRAQLYDPSSATFRRAKVSRNGDVCGEIDSRNIEGGRTGFARFVYDHKARKATLSLHDPDFHQFFVMDDNEYTNGNAKVITDDACRFVTTWSGLCSSTQAHIEKTALKECRLYNSGDQGRARLKKIIGE